MKKIVLLLLMACVFGTVVGQTTIKMKTTKNIGDDFSFCVDAGLTCFVDWGDGRNDTIVSTVAPISGVLTGKTVTLKTTNLTFLDCSGQDINQLTFTGAVSLQTLDISNNKLIMCQLGQLVNLHTLWCDHNTLTSVDLSAMTKLESFVATGNLLRSVDKPAEGFTELTDFWVGGNRLTTLDLTGSRRIATLNVENNALKSMTLSQLESKALAVFIGGNALDFKSLWNKMSSTKWYGTTQRIDFAQSKYQMGQEFTLGRDLLGYNQDNEPMQAMSFTYSWYPYLFGERGPKLTRGNPGVATADYSTPNTLDKKHLFTFNRAFDDIQLEIKHNKYMNFAILSNHIEIEDPTAVADKANAANQLQIAINGNGVVLSAAEPTDVKVCNAAGILCWHGTVANPTRIPLAKGVYMINNHKVSL